MYGELNKTMCEKYSASKRSMRLSCLAIFIAVLVGCSSSVLQKKLSFKSIPDSVHYQVMNSHFDRFVVSNPAVFKRYEKIIFSTLNFDKFELSTSNDRLIDKSWEFTDDVKAEYAAHFKSEVYDVFGGDHAAGHFGLGASKDDKTLYAEVRLLKFKPRVARDGENTSVRISKKLIDSFGQLTIQILLVDSVSNEFVAVLEDGRDLGRGPRNSRANKATNAYVWKFAFNAWLSGLKKTLVDATSLDTTQ